VVAVVVAVSMSVVAEAQAVPLLHRISHWVLAPILLWLVVAAAWLV